MEIGGWEKFDANGVMGSFWSFCKEVVHISLLKGVQVRVVHGNTIHCGGENHVNFFWRGSCRNEGMHILGGVRRVWGSVALE